MYMHYLLLTTVEPE